MLNHIWNKLKETFITGPLEEPFVTFMHAVKEDPEIRNTLIAILRQNDFNRESILNTYIDEMRYKGAPKALISSLSLLLEKDVAQQACELLANPKEE